MKAVLAWAAAMVVATLGLFGIDALLHWLLDGPAPNLWLGLGFALVVFSTLFAVVFHRLSNSSPKAIAIVTAVTSLGFLVALPAAIVWARHSNGPPIRSRAPIPGRIDLLLVSPAARHEASPRPSPLPPDLAAWDVRYTVAVPAQGRPGLRVLVAGTESRGEALRALRTGRASAPAGQRMEWRPGAQRAVVLDVDQGPVSVPGSSGAAVAQGGPPATDPLVSAISSLHAPVFALLAADPGRRLDEWQAWTGDRRGEANALSDLEGPTLLDAALRQVAESRAALVERKLAYEYRPLLFFDKRELYNWPVDLDAAFAEGAVSICKHAVPGDECEVVRRAADLDQSFDYLKVDPQRFTPADRGQSPKAIGSVYYYHVVRDAPAGGTYVDYWWYLPYNPSLSTWMCSPGFEVTDFDCFDHESDWEGITVKVGVEGKPPLAVYYAQHAHTIRFEWSELERRWAGLSQKSLVDAHGAHHPLVFVARASHASYPNPCTSQLCTESRSPLPEGHHNGGSVWPGDDDATCAGHCLEPLPLTRAGRAATWNAFSGPWGTQTCILNGTFCNRSEAPQSPAFQWRYRHPGVAR